VKRVLRFVDWRISPQELPDAPATTFRMECLTCTDTYGADDPLASSQDSEEFSDVQDWALRHSGRNPAHTSYREHIRRHWRTQMVDAPPGRTA
jgi:hypothetical protein